MKDLKGLSWCSLGLLSKVPVKVLFNLLIAFFFSDVVCGTNDVYPQEKKKLVHFIKVYFHTLCTVGLLCVFDLVTIYVFFCCRALQPVGWRLKVMPSSPATSERPFDATATRLAPFPHSQYVITEL